VLLVPALVAIIGGTVDTQSTWVVNMTIAGGQCSGVVVAPRVVVTAAHCVVPANGAPNAGTVDFGGTTATIVATWVDRQYGGDVAHDLAAVRLDRDAPAVSPWPIGAPLEAQLVTLIGFGATAPGGSRDTRHAVVTQAYDLGARQFWAGSANVTTCTGDSGGAAFGADPASDGATQFLVGIISAGDCMRESQLVRPDADADLARVIAAWSGACPADGTCDALCADPDCDACGFNGTCNPGCDVVDLDCPLAGKAGDTCTTALDCESRECLGDERGRFCSAECTNEDDCPLPLDACTSGTCTYKAGTPGIAGAACATDADCRSGLCDVNAAICTVPCGHGELCPTGLACEPVRDTRACTLGSGCAVGGSTPGPLVLAIIFMIRRRRY
jgi:hypothetical protein